MTIDEQLARARREGAEAMREACKGPLRAVVDAWTHEANQGDGILEEHEGVLLAAQAVLEDALPLPLPSGPPTALESLRAEVERMRPVVEAALAWRRLWGVPATDETVPVILHSTQALRDAVDAFDASTP